MYFDPLISQAGHVINPYCCIYCNLVICFNIQSNTFFLIILLWKTLFKFLLLFNFIILILIKISFSLLVPFWTYSHGFSVFLFLHILYYSTLSSLSANSITSSYEECESCSFWNSSPSQSPSQGVSKPLPCHFLLFRNREEYLLLSLSNFPAAPLVLFLPSLEKILPTWRLLTAYFLILNFTFQPINKLKFLYLCPFWHLLSDGFPDPEFSSFSDISLVPFSGSISCTSHIPILLVLLLLILHLFPLWSQLFPQFKLWHLCNTPKWNSVSQNHRLLNL